MSQETELRQMLARQSGLDVDGVGSTTTSFES